MQNYTKLKIAELRERFIEQCHKEQDKAASSYGARGFTLPGDLLFVASEETNMKQLDVLINKIFSIEKTALQNDRGSLDDNYFETFKDEFIKEAEGLLKVIFAIRRGSYEGNTNMNGEDIYPTYRDKYTSRIRNRVDIMKEEIRLGMTGNPGGTTINVGGDVGAINTGTVYGTIHGKIEKLNKTDSALTEAFNNILEAIKKSKINDGEKLIQMQNVEFLIDQHEVPKEKRNNGLISTSLNLLSLAANLATLWGQFGPVIMGALK
ncbi:MAG: hypothetical protein Q8M71_06290 [Thermodesulfovibrionales bacterium]|nr:hypothetical protein [Thermodesulfovibrionales bacterium]